MTEDDKENKREFLYYIKKCHENMIWAKGSSEETIEKLVEAPFSKKEFVMSVRATSNRRGHTKGQVACVKFIGYLTRVGLIGEIANKKVMYKTIFGYETAAGTVEKYAKSKEKDEIFNLLMNEECSNLLSDWKSMM